MLKGFLNLYCFSLYLQLYSALRPAAREDVKVHAVLWGHYWRIT